MDNFIDTIQVGSKLALLQFDGIILGFAQSQILTIENFSTINNLQTNENSSDTFLQVTSEIPVYTFNNELVLMAQPFTENRFRVAIKHSDNNKPFAIMCDAVNHYVAEDATGIYAIPPLLYNPDSPVIGLVKNESKLVLLVSAESMQNYINSQEVEYA